jgi:hypothetical protein
MTRVTPGMVYDTSAALLGSAGAAGAVAAVSSQSN